jgi:hypothetical protein
MEAFARVRWSNLWPVILHCSSLNLLTSWLAGKKAKKVGRTRSNRLVECAPGMLISTFCLTNGMLLSKERNLLICTLV